MDDMRRWRHTWTGIELAVQAMKAHDDQGVQEAAICLLCKLSLKVQLAARIKEVTGGVEAIERAVALSLGARGARVEVEGAKLAAQDRQQPHRRPCRLVLRCRQRLPVAGLNLHLISRNSFLSRRVGS